MLCMILKSYAICAVGNPNRADCLFANSQVMHIESMILSRFACGQGLIGSALPGYMQLALLF